MRTCGDFRVWIFRRRIVHRKKMLVSFKLGQIRLGSFFFVFYGELSLRQTVLRRKILEPFVFSCSLYHLSLLKENAYTFVKVALRVLYDGRPTTTIAVGDPLTFRLEPQPG